MSESSYTLRMAFVLQYSTHKINLGKPESAYHQPTKAKRTVTRSRTMSTQVLESGLDFARDFALSASPIKPRQRTTFIMHNESEQSQRLAQKVYSPTRLPGPTVFIGTAHPSDHSSERNLSQTVTLRVPRLLKECRWYRESAVVVGCYVLYAPSAMLDVGPSARTFDSDFREQTFTVSLLLCFGG